MNVAVVIPAHCSYKVLHLTIGSWLESKGDYEFSIDVGLHNNYGEYSGGLEDIMSVKDLVNFHFVDEINWYAERLMRYSKMHAINLMHVLGNLKNKDFTHVAILDNDLLFNSDFIGWVLDNHSDADVVGCLFDNRDFEVPHKTLDGGMATFAPKFSIWHMVISRRCFEKIMADPSKMMPSEEVLTAEGHLHCHDTFSHGLKAARGEWGFDVVSIPENRVATMVRHWGSASFNFGARNSVLTYKKPEQHGIHIKNIEDEYDRRFPEGIGHLIRRHI